jgi:hypothetical protein
LGAEKRMCKSLQLVIWHLEKIIIANACVYLNKSKIICDN